MTYSDAQAVEAWSKQLTDAAALQLMLKNVSAKTPVVITGYDNLGKPLQLTINSFSYIKTELKKAADAAMGVCTENIRQAVSSNG